MLLEVPEGKSSLLAGLRGPPRKQAVRGWEDLEKWTPPSSSREKPGGSALGAQECPFL